MTYFEFGHEAMATTFLLGLRCTDGRYARQAALATFRELDRLEGELSRFVETSDVSRINRLGLDESTVIGEECQRCLLAALQLSEITDRAFDPTYRSVSDPSRSPGPLLLLDPGHHRITANASRLTLDFGAVGKGYALDQLVALLQEWNIPAARVVSGGSTVLGYSREDPPQEWSVQVGDRELLLRNQAAAASGLSVQGNHIVDPRRGTTAERRQRTWAFADRAVDADALSTAFFVMTDETIADFCRRHPDYGAATLDEHNVVHFYGRIPEIRTDRA